MPILSRVGQHAFTHSHIDSEFKSPDFQEYGQRRCRIGSCVNDELQHLGTSQVHDCKNHDSLTIGRSMSVPSIEGTGKQHAE